jgi:dolichol-phosphate mannosyltransferase
MEGLFNIFMKHLTVVIPVYNESTLIGELVSRVKQNVKLISEDYEIILVDDGSQDKTWEFIEFESNSEKRVRGIKFSRNFGHHYAITAGIHNSNSEWVVVMDGDLQDRPEVIPELYNKALEGFDVVFVSRQNRPEKLYYRIAQKFFYLLLRKLSGIDFDSSQANFSIIHSRVVEAFKLFPENTRFYGSTIKWLGFSKGVVYANHGKRFSGKPSYTLKKRIKLAFDIILSFSERPLRFAIGSGILIFISAVIITFWILFNYIFFNQKISELFSILSVVLFGTGLILVINGIIGIYIGQIFNETKKRPLYIIEKCTN